MEPDRPVSVKRAAAEAAVMTWKYGQEADYRREQSVLQDMGKAERNIGIAVVISMLAFFVSGVSVGINLTNYVLLPLKKAHAAKISERIATTNEPTAMAIPQREIRCADLASFSALRASVTNSVVDRAVFSAAANPRYSRPSLRLRWSAALRSAAATIPCAAFAFPIIALNRSSCDIATAKHMAYGRSSARRKALK